MKSKRKIFLVLTLIFVLCFGFYQAARALGAVSSQFGDEAKIDIGTLFDFPAGTVKAILGSSLIIFSDAEGIYAVSTKCTHRGCTLNFQKSVGQFLCSCHGAKFDQNGTVVRGPAKADLPWFAVTQDVQGRLYVDKTKAVPRGTKFK